MTEIKICGLTCEDDIKIVNELEVEYAGFVFVKKSKIYLYSSKVRPIFGSVWLLFFSLSFSNTV